MRTGTGILVAVLWVVFTACCVDGSSDYVNKEEDHQGQLLLILMDGVRWNQVLDPAFHGFDEIIQTGVLVDHMQSVFLVNSYVNNYAIATGNVETEMSIFVSNCTGCFQMKTSGEAKNFRLDDAISVMCA